MLNCDSVVDRAGVEPARRGAEPSHGDLPGPPLLVPLDLQKLFNLPHEIGVRLALGASRSNILRIVLRQGLGLAIVGAAVGLVCSLIVSHLMASLLYGVRPTDPLTFVGVALVFISVALFACYIPARRAMKLDPMIALRCE